MENCPRPSSGITTSCDLVITLLVQVFAYVIRTWTGFFVLVHLLWFFLDNVFWQLKHVCGSKATRATTKKFP